jgi:hypothetical protein
MCIAGAIFALYYAFNYDNKSIAGILTRLGLLIIGIISFLPPIFYWLSRNSDIKELNGQHASIAILPLKYKLKRVKWQETGDATNPYSALVNSKFWTIRINDFPKEQLYTLLIDGIDIGNFDNWPILWKK